MKLESALIAVIAALLLYALVASMDWPSKQEIERERLRQVPEYMQTELWK